MEASSTKIHTATLSAAEHAAAVIKAEAEVEAERARLESEAALLAKAEAKEAVFALEPQARKCADNFASAKKQHLQVKAESLQRAVICKLAGLREGTALRYTSATREAAAHLHNSILSSDNPARDGDSLKVLRVVLKEVSNEHKAATTSLQEMQEMLQEATFKHKRAEEAEVVALVEVEAKAEARVKCDRLEAEARARLQALDTASDVALVQVWPLPQHHYCNPNLLPLRDSGVWVSGRCRAHHVCGWPPTISARWQLAGFCRTASHANRMHCFCFYQPSRKRFNVSNF